MKCAHQQGVPVELFGQRGTRNAERGTIGRILVAALLAGWLGAADSEVLNQANALTAAGDRAGAIALLEPYVAAHPEDEVARRTLLAARINRAEDEVRAVLSEQAGNRNLLEVDKDYAEAKARADTDVARRLEVAEMFLSQERFPEAAGVCNAILRDHPHDRGAMLLKYQILDRLVKRERAALLKEQDYRFGEGINDAIEDAAFPREKPRAKRQVFIFDEDLDQLEQQRVRNRLQERISLDLKGTEARPVLEQLFAVAGINYVLLDESLDDKKLTVKLTEETIETALDALARMVKLRFNYARGTVFVSGEDDGVLVTQIIRLQSGLTDVEANVSAQSQLTQGPVTQSNGGAPGAGGGPMASPFGPPAGGGPGGAGGPGAQGGAKSDLERFIEKIPEIVVGWPAEGKIYIDRKSNTVYVRATPHAISEVQRLLHALDYNNVQVLIEARFVEVAESGMRQLGVSWQGQVTDSTVNAVGVGTIGTALQPAGVIGAANGGMVASGVAEFGRTALVATLRALEEEGKSNNLAEPKILTINNSRGVIEVTKEISYISGYTNQGTGQIPVVANGVTTYTQQTALVPQFSKDTEGISLVITPSVARNSEVITLRLEPTVKIMTKEPEEIEFNIAGGTDGNGAVTNKISRPPEFSNRKLTTSLHVQNGQTVALGGLTDQRSSEGSKGVPYMKDIPFLGQLFREDTSKSDRRNLIILVTANIVEPNGAKVGDELQRLRDTARVVLPDGIQGPLEAAPLAPEAVPQSVRPDIDPNPNRIDQKGRRP